MLLRSPLIFCNLQDKINTLDHHDLCSHLRGVDEVSDGASQTYLVDARNFSIFSLTSVMTVSPWSWLSYNWSWQEKRWLSCHIIWCSRALNSWFQNVSMMPRIWRKINTLSISLCQQLSRDVSGNCVSMFPYVRFSRILSQVECPEGCEKSQQIQRSFGRECFYPQRVAW